MKEKIRLSGVPETMLQTNPEGLGPGAPPAWCICMTNRNKPSAARGGKL